MDATSTRVTEQEDAKQGIDSQAMFDRVVFVLAAIPPPSVSQGRGDGRCVVRSRHGQKGGRRCGSGHIVQGC
jgi:protein-L-isoaspartate O-methyltransferase